jgi:signal transduction histidine kinase
MTVNVLGRRLPATVTYVVALGTAFLLLALTVGAALWQADAGTDLNALVRETADRRGHYRVLLQRLTDAETAQRGYVLTEGEAKYLEPFLGAGADVEREMVALEADAAANPELRNEIRRLRELVSRKFDELQLTVDLQGRGRRNEALIIMRTDRGRELMDEVRAIVDRAETRESARLLDNLAADDRANARLRWVIILAGILIFGIGALLLVTVRGAMRELRIARDDAQAAHARVVDEMGAREQAESKVRQMQKMEAIGQITGGVAHDFNNMLAVIMSALQLARRRLDRGEKGAETFIDAAVDGARRAASLTNRLLAFARRQPLSPTVMDVNRVLGDMSDLLRRSLGEQVELETVLAGGLWRVNADRAELEQAILNICVNARDAMPDGGKLTIESGNAFLDEAYAAANIDVTAGQYVLIAITDSGAGMDGETRTRAFEPFFTTKDIGKGTGLGLSQVHGFLKQSGGHAAIYSEVGHGTTVKLYLPRTHLAETELAAVTPETADVSGDPATIILVVEDEERVRSLSVASLRELGYTVLHASSGPAALQILEANPNVALLFTDVVMPEMSGKVLADEARTRNPALRVLYTTGYTQNAIVHNGVLDADARLLLKPYSLNDLARKVRAVLKE